VDFPREKSTFTALKSSQYFGKRHKERNMPREIHWTDVEEIGIQLVEKYPEVDPLTVRFTDLHRYVTELEGFADDPAKSNESRLEAIQMAWHEEYQEAQG
jgi:FeS assembly protein IscX